MKTGARDPGLPKSVRILTSQRTTTKEWVDKKILSLQCRAQEVIKYVKILSRLCDSALRKELG